MKVPSSISFERRHSIDHQSTASTENTTVASSPSTSADELQALNTALCFLASINADANEIDSFLRAHPQALLLEGAGPIPDECARFIIEHHLQRCHCFAPTCSENRLRVLKCLEQGFEHYDWERWCHPAGQSVPAVYLEALSKIERDIRIWRAEEMILRHRLLETAREVRESRRELDQSKKRSILLSCATKAHEIRSALEQRLQATALNFSSVEREHGELLRNIRASRQVQFSILKQVFAGCRRHVCTVQEPVQEGSV